MNTTYTKVYVSEAYVPETFGVKEIIIEDAQGNPLKKLQVEGEFSRAGVKNKNRRIYPEEILSRETMKLAQIINERGGIHSELDHPLPGESKESLALAQRITQKNACGLITSMEMKGNVVYGKMEILEDGGDAGKTMAASVRRGWKPGISSRALGSEPQFNAQLEALVVPTDINFITYDCVSNPSSFNAVLEQAMNEEVEYYESLKSSKEGRYLLDFLEDQMNA